MKVSKLLQPRPTTLPVDVGGGDTVTIVYDRALATQAFALASRPIIDKVADLLISADLMNDDGTPYAPLSMNGQRAEEWKALLAPFPTDVIAAIHHAIWDDVWAGPKAAAGSSAT